MTIVATKPLITPEDVIAAYEKTGLKPVHGTFTDENCNGGCMITALICDKQGFTLREISEKMNGWNNDELVEYLGVPESFNTTALYDGFDQNGWSKDTEEYAIGFAVREELKKRGMID